MCTCVKELRHELIRALIEANDGDDTNERGAESFNELVKTLALKHDLEAFAFKTKAMVHKMLTDLPYVFLL